MAENTPLNAQITDAVTQANVKVVAEAPAMAGGTLYQSFAQAIALSLENAVASQQQWYATSQAATTQAVNLLFSVDTASTAVATQDVLTGNALATTLAQLNAALAASSQGASTAATTPIDRGPVILPPRGVR